MAFTCVGEGVQFRVNFAATNACESGFIWHAGTDPGSGIAVLEVTQDGSFTVERPHSVTIGVEP